MLDVKNLEVENSVVARRRASEPDLIDGTLEFWQQEIPSLDADVEGIVSRITKLERYLERMYDETLEQFGLSWGEWKTLSALRYSGAPYRSSPGQLAEHLELSSGAMTARLDKLEKAGTIRRLPDPDDRRAVVVELTDAGRRLWEETIGAQAEKESIVRRSLTKDEQRLLNDLLRRLMNAFAQEHGEPPKRKPR